MLQCIVTRINDKRKHQQHFTSVQPSWRLSKRRVSCRRFEEVTLQTGRCEESSVFMVSCLHLFAKSRTSHLRGVCEGAGVWMASSAGFRLISGWVSFALTLCPAAEGEEGRGESAKQVYFRTLFFLDRKRNANAAY